MIAVLLGLVELPDGGFLAARVPLVFSVFLPAIKHRLVLPLVRRASEHQRLLFPDAAAGEVEACIGKSPAEVQTFGVRMEHIDGSIASHDGLHIGESVEQELIECVVCHVVVLNLPSRAFIVHIVRRVCDHEVGLDVAHQSVVGFLLRGITANQTVPTERPNVANFGEGGLF